MTVVSCSFAFKSYFQQTLWQQNPDFIENKINILNLKIKLSEGIKIGIDVQSENM